MKTFLLKILKYLSVTVAATVVVLLLMSGRYWTSRLPVIKETLIPNATTPISLVLGSSHAFYGVNTHFIDSNCYNMALISQSLFEDYYILKQQTEKRTVKYIVLPISYFTNAYYLSETTFEGEAMRMFDYEHAYNMPYSQNMAYLKNKIYLPAQILRHTLFPKPEYIAVDAAGNMISSCTGKQNDISDTLVKFNRHNEKIDFSKRNAYLDSILVLCKQKNIKVNLVVFPFVSGYRQLIEKNGQGFNAFVNGLDTLTQYSFKLMDYRNLITENEAYYFNDADHLSACGRDSLSAVLSRNILR